MTASTPTMPTHEEVRALWTALANFRDEMLQPLARQIYGVTNTEGSATFEDIGVLLTELYECRDMVRDIEREFAKLEDAALEDLPFLARDGQLGSVPRYDEYGQPNYVRKEDKASLTDQAIERYFPGLPEEGNNNA
jgi:hypothetical protein